MKKISRISVALCIIISQSILLAAQPKPSMYEIGFHLGAALYSGDLVPTLAGSYKSPGLFFGIDGSRKLNNSFAVRASLSRGKIKADDANYSNPSWKRERNFNFNTSITEIAANIIWNPFGNSRLLTPYVFAGVGYSFLKVTRDYSNFNENYFASEPQTIAGLSNDIARSLPKGIAVLPVGAGIRYPVSNKISLNLESAYRLMSTDYLDGFSEAANPKRKDAYFTHTIGVVYTFGTKSMLDCPSK